MAADPLAVAVFTVLPLTVLAGGFVLTVWGAVVRERRLLIGSLLLGLMGAHQVTEVWLLLTGANPLGNVLGEVFETSVNLLAVLTVGVLGRRLQVEQRKREQQAVVTRELGAGPIPGAADQDTDRKHRSLLGPATFQLPVVGRLASWAFVSLPLGTTATLNTVIETATRNLQVTYPAMKVDREAVPERTVFAEATTLVDITETILKQLVLYNDSSEPEIRIRVRTEGSRAIVEISDNGPALPAAVSEQLTGRATEAARPDLELGPVHALLEQWGGSIDVTDSTVELTLLRPYPRDRK
ncbi:histidine kinase [Halodesulfurarchaeum formicicum]|uniref:Two-component sensor histidine kinase n=1 Tax=Halodesulfurarchaeum formicicum TaxID=1873524 RepID=A0A1J1AE55_9EURY|nr:ATP-binding protein [Halodesulfurarchaeum formicicum]APE96032.1 two-component sensor histidine kinase [Halodesulfurarchaeum formicicum]